MTWHAFNVCGLHLEHGTADAAVGSRRHAVFLFCRHGDVRRHVRPVALILWSVLPTSCASVAVRPRYRPSPPLLCSFHPQAAYNPAVTLRSQPCRTTRRKSWTCISHANGVFRGGRLEGEGAGRFIAMCCSMLENRLQLLSRGGSAAAMPQLIAVRVGPGIDVDCLW